MLMSFLNSMYLVIEQRCECGHYRHMLQYISMFHVFSWQLFSLQLHNYTTLFDVIVILCSRNFDAHDVTFIIQIDTFSQFVINDYDIYMHAYCIYVLLSPFIVISILVNIIIFLSVQLFRCLFRPVTQTLHLQVLLLHNYYFVL